MLTINALMATLIILMWIGTSFGSNEQKMFVIMNTFAVHLLFLLNVYMNCYFHRMGMFYIDALSKKFNINVFQSKFAINSVTCIMIIAQLRILCIHFESIVILFSLQEWQKVWSIEIEIAEFILDYIA